MIDITGVMGMTDTLLNNTQREGIGHGVGFSELEDRGHEKRSILSQSGINELDISDFQECQSAKALPAGAPRQHHCSAVQKGAIFNAKCSANMGFSRSFHNTNISAFVENTAASTTSHELLKERQI